MDSTKNEVEGIQISGFPTLKFFRKDTNEVDTVSSLGGGEVGMGGMRDGLWGEVGLGGMRGGVGWECLNILAVLSL